MALVFRSPAKDGHVRSAGTRKSHLPIAVTLAVCGLLLSSVGCGSTSNAAARLRQTATPAATSPPTRCSRSQSRSRCAASC